MTYNSYTYTDEEWTTTLPTEAGWYWAYRADRLCGKPDIVYVIMDAARGVLVSAAIGWNDTPNYYELNHFTHWLGPLPVPELPKD